MSPDRRDDDLERRLRDVLHDSALGQPVEPDAIERIHAGARRRQLRRNAVSSLGAVAVIAIAAAGIALRPHGHAAVIAAASQTPTVTHSAEPSPSSASSAPAIAPSVSPSTVPTNSNLSASATSSAPGFQPVSVSAVSTNTYWVLGRGACVVGASCAAVVEQTTDGGKTFKRLGQLADGSPLPPVPSDSGTGSGTTVHDIRFGDGHYGWMYGGALYATRDGGATWSPDSSIPNDVVDLAAASGDVWAVTLRVVGSSESYGLYHATYGSGGTSAWSEVQLGVTFSTQPRLAVTGKTALLLDLPSTGQSETFVIANGGASYSKHAGPCGVQQQAAQDVGSLSVAGDGSLWALCLSGSGHSSAEFVSADQGAHWAQSTFPLVTYLIGGVDATHAVVYDDRELDLISLSGGSPVGSPPNATSAAAAGFIGFTTNKVGFLIAYVQQTGNQLWRTTDGGKTWAVVTF